MRQIALDVHQGFCEVAIREEGETRSAGRVATDRAALELFAGSLCPTDEVVMEADRPGDGDRSYPGTSRRACRSR